MKLLSRALAALPCLSLTAALAAGAPLAVKPGTELVLTPAGGPASVQLHQGRVTLASMTTLTVTPDPLGESVSRQWVLPAGTEIDFAVAPGQALRRLDLARSVDLEVVTDAITPDPGQGGKYPPTFAPKATVVPEATTTFSTNPDPGSGSKNPPT
ncbi:MAG: hypothetical protein JSR28_14355 [Proteobacteria bacterium]|nr:hypothetical protein [Pseudomonadota bacterium]